MSRAPGDAVKLEVRRGNENLNLEAKLATLRYFVDTMIPEAVAAADVIVNGSEGTLALAEAAF